MMNLVGSHDTQRIISDLDGAQKSVKAIATAPSATALQKVRLIPLIQMTYPGAPTIYYGDEAAIPGADDPDNRRGMIWGKGNKATVEWYAQLTNIRNAYPVLRTGDIVPITVDDTNKADVMAYSRNNKDNHAVIAINRKNSEINGIILSSNAPVGTVLTNTLNTNETYTVDNDGKITVNIPKYSGVILVASSTAVNINTEDLKDAYDEAYLIPIKEIPQSKGLEIKFMTPVKEFKLLEEAKATFRVTNNTKINQKVTLIMGLFDEQNRLINYVLDSQVIEKTKTLDLSGSLKILLNGYKVKFFVWSSLEDGTPLLDSIEIPVVK